MECEPCFYGENLYKCLNLNTPIASERRRGMFGDFCLVPPTVVRISSPLFASRPCPLSLSRPLTSFSYRLFRSLCLPLVHMKVGLTNGSTGPEVCCASFACVPMTQTLALIKPSQFPTSFDTMNTGMSCSSMMPYPLPMYPPPTLALYRFLLLLFIHDTHMETPTPACAQPRRKTNPQGW